MPSLDENLAACRPLIDIGAAVHWLAPRKKNPVDNEWSTAPVYSVKELTEKYREGYNVGIRLGEPSKTRFGYLHLIDLDIRSVDYETQAWDCLLNLIPEARSLPSVISGSGGSSRHLYFFSPKPLRSEKLAKSSGFNMVFDRNLGREVKKSHWEIDLFGTGKQVVLPPSIHPDTGLPYVWECPIDFVMLDLGFVPSISTDFEEVSSEIEDDDDLGAIVRQLPMDLGDDEVDAIVDQLPEDWVEDRETWLQVGAALHHQYQGSQIGFDKWCEWSRTSAKFEMKTQKSVWKSFKGNSNPIRMATLIGAVSDIKLQSNLPVLQTETDPLMDLLGSGGTVKVEEPKPDPEWTSLLDRNEEGVPKGVLGNARLIVKNDPRTFGVIAFNSFRQEVVLLRSPAIVANTKRKPTVQLTGTLWEKIDPVNGKLWTDNHDTAVRLMIEAPPTQGGYGFKLSDRDLRGAVNLVAIGNSYHPVAQYLSSLRWDGQQRVDRLFIDYLGCDDTPYHREVARMTLLGAVARVFEPGHKFDFVPILEGFQGKRKSTFISILGRGWFSELAGDLHNNAAMVEQVLGSWIVEIPELQGFGKADTNILKAWISRTEDKVRLAYERRAAVFPRQCIFIGSTNDDSYLKDPTGARRFWPIRTMTEGEIDTERLEREIDQVWAEAVALYQSMRERIKLKNLPLHLQSVEAIEEAQEIQESRRVETVEDALAGFIEKWLNEPIGADSGFDDLDPAAPAIYRQYTCVTHIWAEMMGHDIGRISRDDQTRIGTALNRVKSWEKAGQLTTAKYGRQRLWRRRGAYKPVDI